MIRLIVVTVLQCVRMSNPHFIHLKLIYCMLITKKDRAPVFFFFFKSIFDRVIIKLSGIHLKQCRYGNLFFSSLNFMTGKYRSVIFDDNFST